MSGQIGNTAVYPELIEGKLLNNLGFEPTPSQEKLLFALSRFLISPKPNCLLVIKGYAGTGKTTTVNALTKTLKELDGKFVLLAPTGRAAKVMSNYTGEMASTIHRKIYFQQKTPGGGTHFVPGRNLHTDTVFIVDEASMIGSGDYSRPGGGNLLDDLFEYVFNGRNCRLILIGDDAQLPPVGSDESPALQLSYLKSSYSITSALTTLSDVTRQKEGSGILDLATTLREVVAEGHEDILPIKTPANPDVEHISGMELQDFLEDSFGRLGPEGTMLITRSNKRANQFNQEIRARVYFREEKINGGDFIMAVKNNYHWLGAESRAGFIANGDVMEVVRLGNQVSRYGFNFQHATIRLIDYPEEPETEVVLWLDTLDIEAASMPRESTEMLYRNAQIAYEHLQTKKEIKKALNEDPYLNSLQIKFSYAVTCHKAQGGQWPVVFVDQGYLTEEMLDTTYFRWLYTAVTRATEKLYLLNFSDLLLVKDVE